MKWIRLIYFPEPIKTHIVHCDVLDVTKRDILSRHGKEPQEEIAEISLRVDPGGMIMMNNDPMDKDFDGANISVKPEHILNATHRWTRHRILNEKTSSGELVYKVYLSEFCVATVPEKIYFEVGAWLAGNEAEGHVSRAELSEILSGIPNLIVSSSPSKGDA